METLLSLQPAVTILAIVGSGLMAGLFFVFSFSVMDALSRMPADEGMKAMQLINRTILNPVFLGAFFTTTLACLLVIALSLWRMDFGWATIGSAAFLIGGFAITAARNVPLNEALDSVKISSIRANEVWADYIRRWTRWNHIRTAACAGATISLAIGLC